MLDKNSQTINVGDFICLCNHRIPYQVESKTSLGISINSDFPINLDILKEMYRKPSNTVGFIPLFFLDNKRIQLCPKEYFPECYI